MTTIGDLVIEYKELPAAGSDFEVLTLTEKNGFVRQSDRFHKRLATEDTSKYKVVRRNGIAFNPYLLWAGAVAQNTIVDAGIISPLYPTFRVRSGFDARYVARLLLTPQMIALYDTIAFGSVPRRRRSSVSDFLALQIPDPPPLDEQRRIAAILDHADALRAKRREVIAQLDGLAQSIFVDMFGDPVRNPRRWPRTELSKVIRGIDSGSSPVCEARPAQNDEWAVLKLGAVSYGTFNADENKAFLGDVSSLRRAEVQPGDLLFSRKNTKELVGATVVVRDTPPRRLLPDLIFRLHLNHELVNADYLHSLLSNRRKRTQIVTLASGSASSMANISQSRLLGLPIELPPLSLQQNYADRVRALAAVRQEAQRLSDVYAQLFASLQSRAFRGEL